jgi:vanillate/3-O-methylgallate O-demethylase
MSPAIETQSLEDLINEAGSPIRLLRDHPVFYAPFPIQPQYTNWRDEQRAWKETAVLFDQSFHMTDLYLRGPDVQRLLSDTAVNGFANFATNKAKQFLAVNDDGMVIGEAILFGLSDDEVSLVGRPLALNWVQYRAETGGYDVEVIRDERSLDSDRPGRISYRLQIQGPRALDIVEQAHGGPLPEIPFFNIGRFELAGCSVRALNHTMVGIPGHETTGLELMGPFAEAERVREALLEAGKEFGLKQGGALAYGSTPLASGYLTTPMTAIYDSPDLRAFRQWLGADSAEARLTLGGSFASDRIADYYETPWDLGYGHLINFDHDFIGRDALLAMADKPHRRKVFLRWNDADVSRLLAGGFFEAPDSRFAPLNLPVVMFCAIHRDQVLDGGDLVGLSAIGGYTANAGCFFSMAMVNDNIPTRSEVALVWGELDGGASKPWLPSHVQTEIRATVSESPID